MYYNSEFVHNLLPQKEPFVFVNEVLDIEISEFPKMKALWHLTGDEFFFKGHFPKEPILPGVLQIESMAQTATLLTLIAKENQVKGKRPAFIGVEKCRFRVPIVPPIDLIINVVMTSDRHSVFKYSGKIFQKDMLICEADFSASMI